jgi:AraC-like DNA-binding protein
MMRGRAAMQTSSNKNQLVGLVESLTTPGRETPLPLPSVRCFRSETSIPRHPIAYVPSIIIIAQGRKRVYFGDEGYTYDPNNYLVLSVPLPLECETVASPEEPLLGVTIDVDIPTLSDLLVEMDDSRVLSGPVPRGVYSTPLTEEMVCATVRLLDSLHHPLDGRILGPQIVREILYRVLCGEQGGALRSLATRHSRFSQIAKVLKRMHTNYAEEFDIASLAGEVQMSVSSFHATFKAVTSVSPLQFLKNVRLHRARSLMVQDGLNASTAAGIVGYESPSQFNREFKRYFGTTPAEDAAKLRSGN